MHMGFIILQPSYLTHRKTAGFQNDFPIFIFNPQQIHRARELSQPSYLTHRKSPGLLNYLNLI